MNSSIALSANWKVFHHFLASKRIWLWLPRGRPARDNDNDNEFDDDDDDDDDDDHNIYNNHTDDALNNILIIQIKSPRPE